MNSHRGQTKRGVDELYDKPLEIVAYNAAINRCYGESLFDSKVVNSLIVVALRDRDAQTFPFERQQLLNYWQKWLQRLNCFVE